MPCVPERSAGAPHPGSSLVALARAETFFPEQSKVRRTAATAVSSIQERRRMVCSSESKWGPRSRFEDSTGRGVSERRPALSRTKQANAEARYQLFRTHLNSAASQICFSAQYITYPSLDCAPGPDARCQWSRLADESRWEGPVRTRRSKLIYSTQAIPCAGCQVGSSMEQCQWLVGLDSFIS